MPFSHIPFDSGYNSVSKIDVAARAQLVSKEWLFHKPRPVSLVVVPS